MIAIVTLHFLAAAVAPVLVRRLERRTFLVLALVPLGSFLWLLGQAEAAFGGDVRTERMRWIPTIDVRIDLALTPLNAVMALVVTGVGALIHLYSIGYMHDDEGYARFFTYLNLFVFSMVMLVLAGNFLLLYVFWEAVGLCSYLLIGFWYERKSAADAGKKAFIVNRVGDFGFGLGIMLIWTTFGTLSYAEVFAKATRHSKRSARFSSFSTTWPCPCSSSFNSN